MKIAIYSRKSKFTGKGESIENQIEMCKEYAEKHYSNAEFFIYEDEGFSGGSADRPRFQQMLKDAKEKKFEALICYRLDRVSRNIADFSNLIEELQNHGISFISIREQFDTSTPMGRAMMYIASVFAQLERETIAERIRDNMLELAKTGRWLGGVPPLGFESERITYIDAEYKERSLVKLNPVKEEMQQVEYLYDLYLKLGSVHQVRKYLIQNNIKTKNNAYYALRVIKDILRNPAYVAANGSVVEYLGSKGIKVDGEDRLNGKRAILIYNKKDEKGIKNDHDKWVAAVAKHEGYIAPDKWLQVQHMLDKNSRKLPRTGTSEVALLSGLLRCAKCGAPMNVSFGRKRKEGATPHYYICNLKRISSKSKCKNPNANGQDTDKAVINKLLELTIADRDVLLAELEALKDKNKQPERDILSELKNKREELLKEINNLVGEVSKSAAASKYILPQIEARDQEIKKLDEGIIRLEKEKSEKEKDAENIQLVISNILNFSGIIEKLSNREKKHYIQTIIDKVYWDGDTGEVAIQLLTETTDKKKLRQANNLSQFYTASSWERNKTGIVLYQKINPLEQYENYPENTLGQKIQKQRYLKDLTAAELGRLCGRAEVTINLYESDTILPSHAVMEKICTALDVPVSYFEDDYYNFVLSDNYASYLQEWKKQNIKRHNDIEKVLGVAYQTFWSWQKGYRMSRESFERVKEKLFK
jgi:site-specific DNA recombinase